MAKKADSVSSLIANLAQVVSAMSNNNQNCNTPRPNTNFRNNTNLNPPKRYEGCKFCGSTDGHFFRSCPIRQEYEAKNYVKRDNNNRLVMHNGEPIPNTPLNSPLKAKIDAYMRKMTTMYQTGPWNQPSTSIPALLIETSLVNDSTYSNGLIEESAEASDTEDSFVKRLKLQTSNFNLCK
jgi:hypothetical protein